EIVRAVTERIEQVENGTAVVSVSGATPFVDDRSAQGKILSGPGRVVGVRVRRIVHREAAQGREEIEALSQAGRDKARALKKYDEEIGGAVQRQRRSTALMIQLRDALTQVQSDIASWRAAYAKTSASEDAAQKAIAQAVQARATAEDELTRARLRHAEGA